MYLAKYRVFSVRYPSVSLSPTLNRNKNVAQHTRKENPKTYVLKFWIENDVISLCEFDSCLILIRSRQCFQR